MHMYNEQSSSPSAHGKTQKPAANCSKIGQLSSSEEATRVSLLSHAVL